MLTCEKSGSDKATGLNPNDTRKCHCPLRLKGRLVKGLGGWMLKVMCGTDNHILNRDLEGHSYGGRLTEEEKAIMIGMTNNLIKPNHVLDSIKSQNLDSHTTIKQIYNARSRIQYSLHQGRTEVQHLMNIFQCDRYVY